MNNNQAMENNGKVYDDFIQIRDKLDKNFIDNQENACIKIKALINFIKRFLCNIYIH